MNIKPTFLRSRVARHIFVLFILCALLPMVALAVLSFSHVSRQLKEQSQERLARASKSMGMTISGRLALLETEMKMVAASLRVDSTAADDRDNEGADQRLGRRFRGMVLVTGAGEMTRHIGQSPELPQLAPAEWDHVRFGKTLLFVVDRGDNAPGMTLMMLVDSEQPERGVLLAEIDNPFLWGRADDNLLPPSTEVCILDHSNRVIFSSHPIEGTFIEMVSRSARSHSGRFEWTCDGEKYSASYWSVFLKSTFFAASWRVVASESKVSTLAAMADFKRDFALVFLMALWTVLLLSISQIRKRLVPLEMLHAATRRIGANNFEEPVVISSGDEFEVLAASFNTMAARLGKQFSALTTIAEIDRTVLSTLKPSEIVNTLLHRIRDVLPCDGTSVTLVDRRRWDHLKTYVRVGDSESVMTFEDKPFTEEEQRRFRESRTSLNLGPDDTAPRYLEPLLDAGLRTFLLFPLFVQGELAGVVGLGSEQSPELSSGDLIRARQVVDQVAVALSNARLLDDLDELNWGTLIALARTIDAMSPWTAGHSEEVTSLAVEIAQMMSLPQQDLDNLHRGGLLHDIGKIGVPKEILDKPGKLTEEEWRIMRDHVVVGARILEPITAYAGVIPIVRQHHEWFDGNGYPDGVAGEDIDLKARIFAVADCYDALVSDRPYRRSVGRVQAIEYIREGSGTHFDPQVVEAFLAIMVRRAGDADGEARRLNLLDAVSAERQGSRETSPEPVDT